MVKYKSEIHAIIFHKDKYNPSKALKWLKKHDFNPNLMEEKPNIYWFNITDKHKYKKFRMDKIKDGLTFVYGFY